MKKITFLAGVLLALFTNNANAQVDVLGKNEFGRIFDLTYSVTTPNTVYATTISRHILESHDNGATWEPIFSVSPEVGTSLGHLKLSKDGSFLSFSTRLGGLGYVQVLDVQTKQIVKSYPLPNDSDLPWVTSYDFFGNDKETLIAASQFSEGFGAANKVFYTTDGGSNWKQIYYSVDNNNIITNTVAISPADKNKLFIANGLGNTETIGGLLISTDAGNNFTEKLSGSPLSTIEFNPNNANEFYVGTGISFGASPEGLFHSADGGSNFDTKNVAWNSDGILNNIVAIKYNPLDNNNIVVLEEDEFVSTKDGGATWQSVVYPLDNLNSYYYGLGASFNPYKAGEVFISANYAPLFSQNNGDTFTQLKTPFFSSTGQVNFFENATAKHLYYGVQNGFVHRNFADNTDQAYKLQPLNIVSSNDAPIYISDSKKEGRIYSFQGSLMGSTFSMSDDSGANFTTVFSPFSSKLTNVISDPQVTNQVWVTYDNFGQGALDKVNFNDANNVQVTNLTLPVQASVQKVLHPNNISNEFFLLIGSELYKTADGGNNWTPVFVSDDLFSDAKVLDIVQSKINPNNIVLGTSVGTYLSTDKGLTWTKNSDIFANKVFYSDVNPGVLVAATYDSDISTFQLHYSFDNAATWKSIDRKELLHTFCTSINVDFSDKNAYVYIASSDLGLLGYNLDFNILSNADLTNHKSDILIYPNPTADVVHINDKNLKVVALYDLNGRKLMESNKTEMNVSQLPKGVYVIKIVTANNQVISKKLIKK